MSEDVFALYRQLRTRIACNYIRDIDRSSFANHTGEGQVIQIGRVCCVGSLHAVL